MTLSIMSPGWAPRYCVDVYNWLEPDFAVFIPFVAPEAGAQTFKSAAGTRLMPLTPADEFLCAGHDRILARGTCEGSSERPPAGLVSLRDFDVFRQSTGEEDREGRRGKAQDARAISLSAADRTLLRHRAALEQFAHNRETLFGISFNADITLSSTGLTDLRTATAQLTT